MNKRTLFIIAAFTLALLSNVRFTIFGPTPVELTYPKEWGKPNYNFKNNPLTKEGIELGRKIFYDPILSKDSTISCSSCHLSFTAFTHVDHALSHGINDNIGIRNSPSLMNLAWSKTFMWDGSVHHLDMLAIAPITDSTEMGEDFANVVSKLQRSEVYPFLFNQAFGDSTVTGEHFLKALTQFQLTLISANSKYDKVIRGEAFFTVQEQKGYDLFKQNCNSCHQEPLFTTGGFANNGLPVDTTLNDFGRIRITQQSADSLKFKIPTLRNIEYSHPYMHDGRFKKLHQVLKHYESEIHASKTLVPELKNGILLTSNDKVDLTAFLLTLSDKEFVFNPEFAFPRKK